MSSENEFIDVTTVESLSAGPYEIRLAHTRVEVEAAQALRYRTFYVENEGQPTEEMTLLKREVDEWDDIAYHIIAIDTSKEKQPAVVGTLRLVSNKRLASGQNFYTEAAFDLQKLQEHYDKILELSRYCIDPDGRSGSILMLIWKFAMKFIIDHGFDLMLGCASFIGADVKRHQDILCYLYSNNLAPEHLRPAACVDNCIDIGTLEQPEAQDQDMQKSVPTLLRGYLKLGAKISDTAIIDERFNTVFICIYVDAANMIADKHSLVTHKNE